MVGEGEREVTGKGGCEKGGRTTTQNTNNPYPPSHCRPYIRSQPTACIPRYQLTASEWFTHQTTQLMGDTLNPDQVVFVVRFDANGWINCSAVSSLTRNCELYGNQNACNRYCSHLPSLLHSIAPHYAMVTARRGFPISYIR